MTELQEQFNSDKFWIENYNSGGNSGHGSYNENAKFKANFINKFIAKHNIKEAIEYGCGDGNNLGMYNIEDYTGYDISEIAINKCKLLYPNKKFELLTGQEIKESDLVLCVDVLYHLFGYDKFKETIKILISKAKRFVIFYTTIEPSKRVEGSCMNDYDIRKLLDELGVKYYIDWTQPPDSLARFLVIEK